MPRNEQATPVEMLKAQVLMTETGYPAPLELVQDCYGRSAAPAPEPGWFWIGATPKAAADIQRRGLRTIGTLTKTYIPPQIGVDVDKWIDPESIPVVGSQEHVALMLAETRISES